MGWTRGERGQPYYTFLRWRDGRLSKQYAGRGEEGEKVQRERREAREEERRLRNEFLELEALCRQYELLAREYVHESLIARGYVFHWGRWYLASSVKGKRGPYRRR